MEYRELMTFSGNVARTLLYLSSLETKHLPTLPQATESEVVNGTISYIGGDAGQFTFTNAHYGYGDRAYPRELFKYFERELRKNGEKLDSQIKEALIHLLSPQRSSGPYSDGYPTTDLDTIVSLFPFQAFSSTSVLSWATIEKIKRTLPLFSPKERKDLECIAECMKPFIEQDLQYIREHRPWEI